MTDSASTPAGLVSESAAWLVRDLIASTAPPGETAVAAAARQAAILDMVRAFAPEDVLETMMVCQCIVLRFLLSDATRALADRSLEEKGQARARGQVVAISRTLHMWTRTHERTRARRTRERSPEARPDRKTPVRAKEDTGPAPAPAKAVPVSGARGPDAPAVRTPVGGVPAGPPLAGTPLAGHPLAGHPLAGSASRQSLLVAAMAQGASAGAGERAVAWSGAGGRDRRPAVNRT